MLGGTDSVADFESSSSFGGVNIDAADGGVGANIGGAGRLVGMFVGGGGNVGGAVNAEVGCVN